MKLSRSPRFVAALIALFSVLYMQFAVASYACPGLSMEHGGSPAAMATTDGEQGMDGCTGMDQEQPSLCHAYGQVGNQSLDKPSVPPVPAFSAVGLVLTVVTTDAIIPPIHQRTGPSLLARPTAPPVSIRNCCFRI